MTLPPYLTASEVAAVHAYRGVPALADPEEAAVADLVARFGASAPR